MVVHVEEIRMNIKLFKKEKFQIKDIIKHNNEIGQIIGIDITQDRKNGGHLWVSVISHPYHPPGYIQCWLRNNCCQQYDNRPINTQTEAEKKYDAQTKHI